MNKLLLALSLSLLSTTVFAADAVVEEVVVDVAPVFSWTGGYVGIQAGGGWGDSDFRDGPPNAVADIVDIDGFLVGGTIGYNYALSPMFVVGLEGDVAYADIDGSFGPGSLAGGFGCGSGPCATEIDWLATLRGRIGVTFDRFMIFGTGGFAVAGVESQIQNSPSYQVDDTSSGWTAGGGVEYAFSDQWSAKVEYLHVDLGDTDQASNGFFTDNDLDIVRAGINFHF